MAVQLYSQFKLSENGGISPEALINGRKLFITLNQTLELEAHNPSLNMGLRMN